MNYRRREKKLFIQEVDDELLIFDQETAYAASLNRPAALVYQLADGTRDHAALAAALSDKLGISPDEAGAMVDVALARLHRFSLLDDELEQAFHERRMSRRKVLRQLAAATIVLPLVARVLAPAPVAAQSALGLLHSTSTTPSKSTPLANGSVCVHNSDCLSGYCQGGRCM